MVQVYAPQRFRGLKHANSPYLPQSSILSGGESGEAPPLFEPRALETRTITPLDPSFEFFQDLTIQKNKIKSGITLTEYPALIHGILGASKILNASGFDIVIFPKGIASVLDFYIVSFNQTTGEFWMKAKIPAAAEFTEVQIAYGKAGATDVSDKEAVYNFTYEGVYDMEETAFGVDSIKDATDNGNDGDTVGGISSESPAIVADGIKFTPSSRIEFPDTLGLPMSATGSISIAIEFFSFTNVSFPTIFSHRDFSPVAFWESWIDEAVGTDKQIRMRYGNGAVMIVAELPDALVNINEKHYFTFTWSQPTGKIQIFVDGNILTSQVVTPWTIVNIDDKFVLGDIPGGDTSTQFSGVQDNLLFASVEWSADLIKAQSNNTLDPDTFWHFSGEQLSADAGNKKVLSIDGALKVLKTRDVLI